MPAVVVLFALECVDVVLVGLVGAAPSEDVGLAGAPALTGGLGLVVVVEGGYRLDLDADVLLSGGGVGWRTDAERDRVLARVTGPVVAEPLLEGRVDAEAAADDEEE